MTLLASETLTIALGASCGPSECSEFAWRMRRQLDTPNYTRGVSLQRIPGSADAWRAERRTARKRADRARRLGYRFAEIDRSQHNDAIHEINTSLDERQGRPMSNGYQEVPAYEPLPDQPCRFHRVHTYGVLQPDTRLRAYLVMYRVGELALVSSILGHGDHLRADIMYLLFEGVVADQADRGGWLYYNSHASGTDGLRYFKERLGFRPADIGWEL